MTEKFTHTNEHDPHKEGQNKHRSFFEKLHQKFQDLRDQTTTTTAFLAKGGIGVSSLAIIDGINKKDTAQIAGGAVGIVGSLFALKHHKKLDDIMNGNIPHSNEHNQ